MPNYARNHYVPMWLQYRFIPNDSKEKKFYYLNLSPQEISTSNFQYQRKALFKWGPPSCFFEENLYTTQFGNWQSTEIEEKFFGEIDSLGANATAYFHDFKHPSANGDAYQHMVRYLSVQKLRTPKGLKYLSDYVGNVNKNHLLIKLQQLQNLFCALWTECIWCIVDASECETKFLLSDHPVTVYNRECSPTTRWCHEYKDPNIAYSGTHTIFPLSLDKALILTNLSWVRNPYARARSQRPNPDPFRGACFNFMHVQTGRLLNELEVNQINYVIKKRAHQFIAAGKKEWLYPEHIITSQDWDDFGKDYLFMPDPRSVTFSSRITFGYENGRADSFDAYGLKPWQAGFDDKKRHEKEWESFLAFQGEFARTFGAKRRGRSFEGGRIDQEEDSPDFHAYHLSLESKYKTIKGT